MKSNATNENVAEIQGLVEGKYEFQDKRDQGTGGTYVAFVFCVYGFLGIIMLVTILNIVNSISMNVSARIRQYGIMRAVGMDGHQIVKMIATKAATYAVCGCIVGGVVGLLVNRFFYQKLITDHFPYSTWSFPLSSLLIIAVFVIFATGISVYGPSKRIKRFSVTETINEL